MVKRKFQEVLHYFLEPSRRKTHFDELTTSYQGQGNLGVNDYRKKQTTKAEPNALPLRKEMLNEIIL